MAASRVLILGGTAEAARLAEHLDANAGFEPITSLAGRTHSPAPLPGAVRMGGFGGSEGLARYIDSAAIDVVIDATHPFAMRISQNALEACDATGHPLLRLERPAWRRQPGDSWIDVADVEAAARRLDGHAKRVFLSIGRLELAPFASLDGIWFLLRMIDRPGEPPPLADFELVLGRGPFDAEAEAVLLARHQIDTIVSKNSGGTATYGKIAAGRRLGLPVVMIGRPSPLAVNSVQAVDDAMNWLAKLRLMQ